MYFKFMKCRLVCKLALQNLPTTRHLVTKRKCYYSVLGLSPGATVGEIKSAYYNLSMVYHPDKNDGSAEAAEMFRSITEAYDVLSNLNRKKLYDKGLQGNSASNTWKPVENIRKRSSVPQYGKTPFYDFDSWTKGHYGKTFRREQNEKAQFNDWLKSRQALKQSIEQELTLVTVLLIFIGIAWFLESVYESALDNPKHPTRKR